ncbi:MAG: type II secretory ATPase GspE/PulE/Tfp pilus assembly ATPase PilB-like protein [Candidatus Pelagisphaera sp.]|jgi:type II secretory ATPase GspE/PulE/Tfp pilus assembly ATPase PilB-like protein
MMREIRSEKFIELIEATGKIETEVWNSMTSKYKNDHGGLLIEIVDKGFIRRNVAGELWARAIGSTFVDPMSINISCSDDQNLPLDMAKRVKAIPLYEFNGYITLAMADPMDRQLVESLERFLQYRISPVFALPDDIERAIDIHYNSELSFDNALAELEALSKGGELSAMNGEQLIKMVESSELVNITNRMFITAFKQNASDIHLESHKGNGVLRFRVNGHLRDIVSLPRKVGNAMIVRIKFLAEMDIANSIMPQDGRFTMEVASFEQNFRISTCPGLHGEKVVIRLLGKAGEKGLPTFDQLFLAQSNLKRFRNAVSKPNGIYIVTGPTGSGKTTTLYSALDYLNDRDRNIMTIEDPVEYQLPGVNHFEVNHQAGLNFSAILRSALRQDPDVILVGEIRDQETAKIATEAALTGHLVLSTLHTNNAVQAILRLTEIGVDPFMVAPSIIGVMSQRLIGRICQNCKEDYTPSDDILHRYFLPGTIANATFYRGRGCDSCNKTGFSGRIAIQEVIEISEEMRSMISNKESPMKLQEAANRIGCMSLRVDALKKALLGLTTLEEVERATTGEYSV